jgi:hypothetical protein
MDFETYKTSLAEEVPPEGLSMAAQALWWEAKGDGTWRINARRSSRMRRAPGRMPIYTVSKAICATPAAGTAAPAGQPRPRP